MAQPKYCFPECRTAGCLPPCPQQTELPKGITPEPLRETSEGEQKIKAALTGAVTSESSSLSKSN